jgi:hypothetical protein
MNILDLVPNYLLCGELKLLYRSGRLQDFFTLLEPDHMALTKIEKMFVRWAIRKYYRGVERELLKQDMLKCAITGERSDSQKEFRPYIPPFPPPSIRADTEKVGLALQNPGGKKTSSKVV